MTANDTEIVSALRTRLAEKVGPERFGMWFAATRMEFEEGRLSIAVPNRFYCEFLKNGFQQELRQACADTLGYWPEIAFSIDPNLDAPKTPANAPTRKNADEKRPARLFAGKEDRGQRTENSRERVLYLLAESNASRTSSRLSWGLPIGWRVRRPQWSPNGRAK